MSTNLDTLRRSVGPVAVALVLVAAGATEAAAQRSRSDARPPASSSSSAKPSVSDSSRGGTSSHASPRSSARDTRPGSSGSSQRIENDTRSHRYRGGNRGGYRGGNYYGNYYGNYWGYYGPRFSWYGYYWGSPWYWGGYPYYGGVTVYPNGAYGDLGALDIDIAPDRAEVYVDGQRIGEADDFDGFPTYLWLKQGTYDVVFYLPGFRTLARQYSIYPGLVIDVEDDLEAGESVRPEDLGPQTHERRDARLRDERERRQRSGAPRAEDWRERAPGAVIEPRDEDTRPRDVRGEPGTLRLRVDPADASVYLDGRFIGTGEELSELRSGLIVDPGSHRLEVVRPGWRSETRSFEANAGGELELEIELDEQP